MINANVVKGVHDLLSESGAEQRQGESFGEFVARALGVSASKAELLLESLDSGATPPRAMQIADIDPASINQDLLTRLATTIGATLGEIKTRMA